jgi:ribosome maturation factor RimP
MALSVEDVVASAVGALKLELVEVERAPRGLLRVYIDRPVGKGAVTVEDCADVSNQLTHQFLVEGIDYERLEVSSPGLDRVLKSAGDFTRFSGRAVKVRLNTMVENRKRFEAKIATVDSEGDRVTFLLLADGDVAAKSLKKVAKSGSSAGSNAKSRAKLDAPAEPVELTVSLSQIEKARLIPDL